MFLDPGESKARRMAWEGAPAGAKDDRVAALLARCDFCSATVQVIPSPTSPSNEPDPGPNPDHHLELFLAMPGAGVLNVKGWPCLPSKRAGYTFGKRKGGCGLP
jgi:hypothetical protein